MGTHVDSAAQAQRPALLRSAIALVVLAVLIGLALSSIQSLTRDQVLRNQQSWLLQRLDALVPPAAHDNDLLKDSVSVTSTDLLGTPDPVILYRARNHGQPVAAIVHTIAPNGYRGPIDLLVAIAADGSLLGVQVLRHNETPGLGDAFEQDNGAWIGKFRGKTLEHPAQQRWTIRKDGGEFDAFTGATITPRAIVKSVRQALEYYRANRSQIFAMPAEQAG
jgi:Na+-translocating ferredoxin:NAD+ oxidoreductase subunit G